ncbi:MAG: hypothetical protein DI537_20245 [Stutzerimonas stutzeri]|nr:MAG: hypothetical protein DI537_20245 [Stutzerimonas stutzeri]
MGILKFWKKDNSRSEEKKIPVVVIPAITQNDVEAAPQPKVPATRQANSLSKELSRNLVELTRRSDQLRSELVRQGLSTL